MSQAILYPENCRRSIRTISEKTGASIETAYAMMLMTALLMDLSPEDAKVTEMVLEDCGVVEEKEDDTGSDVDLLQPEPMQGGRA